MINEYTCRYGLAHNKKCVNGNPSSGNGWLYTAYAKHLGFRVDHKLISDTFLECIQSARLDNLYFIYRLPGKMKPPISRDEVIGLISLGMCPLKLGWYTFRTQGTPNYLKAITALYGLRNKHRNYFWEKEIYEVYPVAMKIWWHDRYYIEKFQYHHTDLCYWAAFQIYALHTILKGDTSSLNILALQLEDLKEKFWLKFINKKENYLKYFDADHPFNTQLERVENEARKE